MVIAEKNFNELLKKIVTSVTKHSDIVYLLIRMATISRSSPYKNLRFFFKPRQNGTIFSFLDYDSYIISQGRTDLNNFRQPKTLFFLT